MITVYFQLDGWNASAPEFVAEAKIAGSRVTPDDQDSLASWAKALAHPKALRQFHAALAKASPRVGVDLPPHTEVPEAEIAEESQTLKRERQHLATKIGRAVDEGLERGVLRLSNAEREQIKALVAALAA